MTRCTIGILFADELKTILLIKKIKPQWQAGRYNFPGGHIEIGETPFQCIAREFKEETTLEIDRWKHIGRIEGKDYEVEILTATMEQNYGLVKATTPEIPQWFFVDNLPFNIISNVSWLIQFARNIFLQGNNDQLTFGIFKYK